MHQREMQNEDNPTTLNKPRIESEFWAVIKMAWEFLEDVWCFIELKIIQKCWKNVRFHNGKKVSRNWFWRQFFKDKLNGKRNATNSMRLTDYTSIDSILEIDENIIVAALNPSESEHPKMMTLNLKTMNQCHLNMSQRVKKLNMCN